MDMENDLLQRTDSAAELKTDDGILNKQVVPDDVIIESGVPVDHTIPSHTSDIAEPKTNAIPEYFSMDVEESLALDAATFEHVSECPSKNEGQEQPRDYFGVRQGACSEERIGQSVNFFEQPARTIPLDTPTKEPNPYNGYVSTNRDRRSPYDPGYYQHPPHYRESGYYQQSGYGTYPYFDPLTANGNYNAPNGLHISNGTHLLPVPVTKKNRRPAVSLVFGLLAMGVLNYFPFIALILAVIALCTGYTGLKQGELTTGKKICGFVGLALGIISLILSISMLVMLMSLSIRASNYLSDTEGMIYR